MSMIEFDDLPKGIQGTRAVPDPVLGALWDSIILEEDLKRSCCPRPC